MLRRPLQLFFLIGFVISPLNTRETNSLAFSIFIDTKYQCNDSICSSLMISNLATIRRCQFACLMNDHCRTASFHPSDQSCEISTTVPNQVGLLLFQAGTVTMTNIIDEREDLSEHQLSRRPLPLQPQPQQHQQQQQLLQPVRAAVANMTFGRQNHKTILLQNGKVLVIGGQKSTVVLNSAEVYDPSANTWTLTSSMNTGRSRHGAVLLSNGSVLVAGGFSNSSLTTALKTAELYHPSSNTWSSIPNMNIARAYLSMITLQNGNVLAIGGMDNGTYWNTVEMYNFSSNTWKLVANMSFSRAFAVPVLLPSGNVLVTGGSGGVNMRRNTSELYDPTTNIWTLTGSIVYERDTHTATLLLDGRVLITGGYSANVLSSAMLYNVSSNSWSMATNMTSIRVMHAATLLPNGKVLVTGGYTDGTYLNTVEFYDPSTNSWAKSRNLTTERLYHTATLMPNGDVLIIGGITLRTSASNTIEIY